MTLVPRTVRSFVLHDRTTFVQGGISQTLKWTHMEQMRYYTITSQWRWGWRKQTLMTSNQSSTTAGRCRQMYRQSLLDDSRESLKPLYPDGVFSRTYTAEACHTWPCLHCGSWERAFSFGLWIGHGGSSIIGVREMQRLFCFGTSCVRVCVKGKAQGRGRGLLHPK